MGRQRTSEGSGRAPQHDKTVAQKDMARWTWMAGRREAKGLQASSFKLQGRATGLTSVQRDTHGDCYGTAGQEDDDNDYGHDEQPGQVLGV